MSGSPDNLQSGPNLPESNRNAELAAELAAQQPEEAGVPKDEAEPRPEAAEDPGSEARVAEARAQVEAATPEVSDAPDAFDERTAVGRLADVATLRSPLAATQTRLAERRDRREDMTLDERAKLARRKKVYKGATALAGMAVVYHAVRHGLPAGAVPPSAASNASDRLRSSNIAKSGAVVDPDRQESVLRRAMRWMERRRAKKRDQ